MDLLMWSIQIRAYARSTGSEGKRWGSYDGYASSRNSQRMTDSYKALPLYSTAGTRPLGLMAIHVNAALEKVPQEKLVRITKKVRFLLVRVHFSILVRDPPFLERNPGSLNVRTEL